jgi:hypothetical protein
MRGAVAECSTSTVSDYCNAKRYTHYTCIQTQRHIAFGDAEIREILREVEESYSASLDLIPVAYYSIQMHT